MALLKCSQRFFNDLLPQVGQSKKYVARSMSAAVSYVDTKDTCFGVRRVTLNDPKTRNSLSLNMMNAIHREITRDLDNVSLRSILLAHTGRIFSSGHNLKELSSSTGEKCHREIFETCVKLMRAIEECPVPVIAAVSGTAAAAGCQLAAACDIVICTDNSKFSTPGVNFGIFCSTPGIPLIRNVPRKIAARMLYTGEAMAAWEAYQAGLVSRMVSADEFENEIERITKSISSKSRSVVKLGKDFVRDQIKLDTETAYKKGVEVMVNNLKLKDAQEGISSFVEKRTPSWTHDFGICDA